jgi:microcystin-dependent protein
VTQFFTIEPNPHWVIIDNFSKLPNGAAIYTYSNINPTVFKPAFEDAGGTIPYGQPIVGFGNGTMPPIFWEFDDTAPTEGYYVRVYDRPVTEPGAQFLWDFNNLFGGGTGGGGTVTTFVDVNNLVINGEFYSNIGNLASTSVLQTLAPSSHVGFTGIPFDSNSAPVSPDIIFAKSNTSATDTISFIPVTPAGSSNLGDNPTPSIYVNYSCTVAGNETYKVFQFPLVRGLQNTSGQEMGCRIFARYNSGIATPNSVFFRFRQFFGNGNNTPSNDVTTNIGGGPLALIAGSWTELNFTDVLVPSIPPLSNIGNCGNDALFLQILVPQQTINIDFILPSVYLGGIPSELDFHTEDEVDAIANSPRTGDVRTSINNVNLGWVKMNDSTIGNTNSTATGKAGTDTFPLFKLIWDIFNTNQTLAPMFTSGGTPTAYGASSVADFTANNQISLTKNLGRVMIGALPVAANQSFTSAANVLTVTSSAGFYTGMAITVSGGVLPPQLTAGTIYYAVILSSTTMSLATTTANAIASTPTVITIGAGSGTIVSVNSEILGAYSGEEEHALGVTEMPAHTHTYNTLTNPGGIAIQGGTNYQFVPANTGSTGGAGSSGSGGSGLAVIPHNTMQPYVAMNVFIKL